ncbi:hypothetical protein KY285_009714 [Solanum tuberosum]|nr:hypothetical protein KY285_009714 [Solanum tuberosum]
MRRGKFWAAQSALIKGRKKHKRPSKPFVDELLENQTKGAEILQHIRGKSLFEPPPVDLQIDGKGLDQKLQDVTPRGDDAMSIIQVGSRLELNEHAEQGNKEVGAVNVEEAIPLNSAQLPETIEPTSDSTVPL